MHAKIGARLPKWLAPAVYRPSADRNKADLSVLSHYSGRSPVLPRDGISQQDRSLAGYCYTWIPFSIVFPETPTASATSSPHLPFSPSCKFARTASAASLFCVARRRCFRHSQRGRKLTGCYYSVSFCLCGASFRASQRGRSFAGCCYDIRTRSPRSGRVSRRYYSRQHLPSTLGGPTSRSWP